MINEKGWNHTAKVITTLTGSHSWCQWIMSNCPSAYHSIRRKPKSPLSSTLYSESEGEAVLLSISETVSQESLGNHRLQQMLRAKSSIGNLIIRDQEENSLTRSRASSRCRRGLEGRQCARKIKNWWVKYDLYTVYCSQPFCDLSE